MAEYCVATPYVYASVTCRARNERFDVDSVQRSTHLARYENMGYADEDSSKGAVQPNGYGQTARSSKITEDNTDDGLIYAY